MDIEHLQVRSLANVFVYVLVRRLEKYRDFARKLKEGVKGVSQVTYGSRFCPDSTELPQR